MAAGPRRPRPVAATPCPPPQGESAAGPGCPAILPRRRPWPRALPLRQWGGCKLPGKKGQPWLVAPFLHPPGAAAQKCKGLRAAGGQRRRTPKAKSQKPKAKSPKSQGAGNGVRRQRPGGPPPSRPGPGRTGFVPLSGRLRLHGGPGGLARMGGAAPSAQGAGQQQRGTARPAAGRPPWAGGPDGAGGLGGGRGLLCGGMAACRHWPAPVRLSRCRAGMARQWL